MKKLSNPKEPKFNTNKWMTEHRDFVLWWKEHRDSGFAEHRDGRQRWGIVPWQAYESERYQADYTGKSEAYNKQEIADMMSAQHKIEKITGELEERFDPMFWKTMTPAEWISSAKMVIREMGGILTTRAKIDQAYAYEPGQSEEETELLARRRE